MKKSNFLFLLSFLLSTFLISQSAFSCACASYEMEHEHRIEGSSDFGDWTSIREISYDVNGGPIGGGAEGDTIYVTADGKKSSKFLYDADMSTFQCDASNMAGTIHFIDENGEVIQNPDEDTYGSFSQLNIGTSGSFVYQHPTKVSNEDGAPEFITIAVLVDGYSYAFDNVLCFNLKALRPPVLMIHGLWSNGGSFDAMAGDFKSNGYEDYMIHQMDYSGSHQDAFSVNYPKVKENLSDLVNACLDEEVAVGSVNVVCHSMGGILTRMHLSNSYDNIIKRVVTCNTPHAGSQMANYLWDGFSTGALCTAAATASNPTGDYTSCGDAIENLRVNSAAISSLNSGSHPSDVEVHALYTNDEPLDVPSFQYYIVPEVITIIYLSTINCSVAEVFDDDTHDLVVATESQKGGLSGSQVSFVDNQQHVGSTANGSVISKVRDLFDEASMSSKFTSGGYNPPTLTYNAIPCNPLNKPSPFEDFMKSNETVSITAPLNGTSYAIGESIDLDFTVTANIDSVIAVFGYGLDTSVLYKMPVVGGSGSIPFVVPSSAQLGNRPLMVFGIDSSTGIYSIIDNVEVDIYTNANLVSLNLDHNKIFLSQTEEFQLNIEGVYDDGTTQNLSYNDLFTLQATNSNVQLNNQNLLSFINTADDLITVSANGITSNQVEVVYFETQGAAVCSKTFTLDAGWNLISFDLIPDNTAIVDVFTGLDPGNLEFVTGFDNGAKVYDPTVPSFLNTLNNIDAGFGYWVRLGIADTFDVQGTCLSEDYKNSWNSGWNLIGYPRNSPQAPSVYFADEIANNNLEFVTGFENGALTFDPTVPPFINSLSQMKNGFGYWVRLTNGVANKTVEEGLSNVFNFINGTSNLSEGEMVNIRTKDGLQIGQMEVLEGGYLMTTPVYGNDPFTLENTGLDLGTALVFEWKGQEIDYGVLFNGDLSVFKVNLSFDKTVKEASIKTFPNPATDIIQLEYCFTKEGKTNLEIYDVNGQQLMQFVNNESGFCHSLSLKVDDFENGVYTYSISNDKERITGKFEVVK